MAQRTSKKEIYNRAWNDAIISILEHLLEEGQGIDLSHFNRKEEIREKKYKEFEELEKELRRRHT
jgi:hypothetical protein